MKKGEQQKILHKGSNDKVNVFITLLYPQNGIKFNTSKTRNSNDFINHLKSIKRYVLKRSIKRFILVIDNASFHVSKKTKQYMERQSDWLTVLFLPTRAPFLNLVETKVNRNRGRNATPPAVSATARGERSTSRLPSTRSSRCSFMLTDACVVPSASAARVKLCSSATRRNACTVSISSVLIINNRYHCYEQR